MTVEQIKGDCDNFPVGLRVLAVDDDPICLKLLETLLRKCQYHVTTTSEARMALKMLRENKNRFDLVISDVHMPDMDGFKLLELVGLEMDLPVIMLSANGDPKLVRKGVTHGACDYLLKPVRIEELKNIWQHVIRKKKIDPKNGNNKSTDQVKARDEGQGSPFTGNTDHNAKYNRKRKDEDDESEDNENDSEENGTQKKPRVVWSIELHRKFVGAVNQLGIEKAVPKRILDLMNVDGLTRENVASHLQKYRLYLKRISSVASQQVNMAAVLGVNDSPFMHMASLDGLGDYRSLTGTRLPNVALSSSFTSNGMLGRLNSSNNLNLRTIAPNPLIQSNQAQNLTNSISSLGKMNLVLPSTPSNQTVNLFQSTLDNNKIDSSRIFSNIGAFSDLGPALGASRNLINSGFVNQPTNEMSSFNSESFNNPGVSGNDIWQNNSLLSTDPFNSQLPTLNGSRDKNSSNSTYFQNDPIDVSSGMGLVSSERMHNYAHGSTNNNNFGSLNCVVSTSGQNMFVNGRLNGNDSTIVQTNENEKPGMELRRRSNEDYVMEPPKLQSGFVRPSYDPLDELMNAMIKREQDDAIPNCDFGLDDYAFGQGI
ncbi:hypothetical protein CASFOL_026847 [Castilleja foliolosa]|uniref:Two-component response regulator n=1 Tax=Castilleja foliolosa TaxID=1961234 RepID=A0ABD3CI78_9LAMI